MPKSKKHQKAVSPAPKRLAAALIVLLGFAFIYWDYVTNLIGAAEKIAVFFIGMILAGTAIMKLLSLNGSYGLYMIGSKRGLSTIDRISKRNIKFWNAMAMWGMVLGFGLLAYPLLKGQISKKMMLFGIISLILFVVILLPFTANILQFIQNVPQLNSSIAGKISTAPSVGLSLTGYLLLIFVVVTGFSGLIFFALIENAAAILLGIGASVASVAVGHPETTTLTNQIPGVLPIIPGIDIPLLAGVASLVILLSIHELSHGILARIAKIKLKSIGLLLFGVVPVGAFVEPDEKSVAGLPPIAQNKILAAGVSSNFIAAVFFFILMLLTSLYLLPLAYSNIILITGVAPNYPANGILYPGMHITSWNGQHVSNITQLQTIASMDKPNSTVIVGTTNGTFRFTAVPSSTNSSRGVIGIGVGQQLIATTLPAQIIFFLYTLFVLSFALNYFVGIANLMPIPGLDGWRIYQVNVKNQLLAKFLIGLLGAALVLNVISLIFILTL